MSQVRYLDYETVVEINRAHCGAGAGVREEDGIRAALGRAEASYGGFDLYPEVVQKAAALLHGLSSTQYFHDGNKRTAWITTKLFLAVNGHILGTRSDVEVEAFVLSIATKAFERDGESDRGLEKAAEWFRDVRRRAIERHVDSFLALETRFDRSALGLDLGTVSARSVFFSGLEIGGGGETAGIFTFFFTCQIHGFADDAGRTLQITVDIHPDDEDKAELAMPSASMLERLEVEPDDTEIEIGPEDVQRSLQAEVGVAPAIDSPDLVDGVHPVLFVHPLYVSVFAPGVIRFRFFLDGELAKIFPFSFIREQ